MEKVWKAICHAFVTAAGPLAFPLSFALSLWEDVDEELDQEELLSAIREGQESIRVLESVVFEAEERPSALRSQIRAGLEALEDPSLELLRVQLLSSPDPHFGLVREAASKGVPLFEASGMLTERTLAAEIVKWYGLQIELFKATVHGAGFPAGKLPEKVAPEVTAMHFVRLLEGLAPFKRLHILKALQEEFDGSEIFASAVALQEP